MIVIRHLRETSIISKQLKKVYKISKREQMFNEIYERAL